MTDRPISDTPDDNAINELEEARKAYEATKAQKGQAVIDSIFHKAFRDDPSIQGFRWTQYTPYFMDGDACIFGVMDLNVMVKKDHPALQEDVAVQSYMESDDDSIVVIESHPEWGHGDLSSASSRLYKVVHEIDLDAHKDVLEHLFGDHAMIEVTRSGYTINEWEHD